jgi:hypothetical protein
MRRACPEWEVRQSASRAAYRGATTVTGRATGAPDADVS